MGLMGVAFMTVPRELVRLVTDEPQLLELTPQLLQICGPVQIFFGTYLALSEAMRGAGDTRGTMRLNYLSTFGLRLPAAYVFGVVMGWGLTGVWIGLCSELVFRGCLFARRFLRGAWMQVTV